MRGGYGMWKLDLLNFKGDLRSQRES